MRVREILNESITFHAATYEEHPKFGRIISYHNMRKKKVECWVCDGSGKDPYDPGYPCEMCHGDGNLEEWISDGPELNVSNSNAQAIIEQIFGMPYDDAGMVEPKDLPQLKRRLIRMKNIEGERAGLEQAPKTSGGQMAHYVDDEGVSRIGRSGQITHMGRSAEQVMRYVDELLRMIDYAQQNNIFISWD